MRAYSRARRLLLQAERYLAVGEGDVRERVKRAYLRLRTLQAGELPVELRSEWQAIIREVTRYGPEEDRYGLVRNSVDHTLLRMRNKTARRIAERIYRLHAYLSH